MTTPFSAPVTEICYVTHDLQRALLKWSEGLKAGPFFTMTIPRDFGTRVYRGKAADDSFTAALGFSGTTLLEFVQPLDDQPSVFNEVLKARGDLAVHHIYPGIHPLSGADFDAARTRYERLGYEAALVMDMPGLGRNILFDARAQLGVFVELLEVTPLLYKGLQNMLEAHLNWDGLRPVREFAESLH